MIPSLREMPAYPVTVGMCVIAAFIFFFAGERGADLLKISPLVFEGEPWRVLSTAFVHGGQFGEDSAYGGILHAGINIVLAMYLAPPLEKRWGHLRMAAFIIMTATISSLAEYALFVPCVGLSGVVYGLLAARWFISRTEPKFEPQLDRRLVILLAFWFFFCIFLTGADLLGVANVAHGVGALMGFTIAALATGNFQVRALAALSLVLSFCVYPLASPRFRPQVNQAQVQGLEYLQLAEQAFSRPDHAAAERYLLACTRYPRCPAKGYYNLGVARERLNDPQGALEAFAQATKLKPGSPNYAAAYERSSAKLAASPTP